MGRELSLREIQLISLEICKKVDMICNKTILGITYMEGLF